MKSCLPGRLPQGCHCPHAWPAGLPWPGRAPHGCASLTACLPPRLSCRCSHGFCLFNNAAIGAAYAMNVYRHAGIRRVAIVDFDVHHGNGTGGQQNH